MENAIEKIDLKNAAEGLRDKVRLEFANAISPEQWSALIEGEIKNFFAERSSKKAHYPYDSEIRPSIFSEMCQEIFKEEIEKNLKTLIDENKSWNGQISELVQEWMTKNSQKILETAVLGFCQMAAQEMLNNMRS